ncbi:MAG: aminotransferase class V-fold PLP-dependent enzyme, partial [Actinobacteria bacterium]|nr:aminotransferase class V-fold PLP-dependent enzyme [Actinomycetota bacterium]
MTVYLDHASTTALRPELVAGYLSQLQKLGNPSSIHGAGQKARQIVEDARDQLAKAFDCHRSEVIFTSGGTEGINIAIKGLYLNAIANDPLRNIIITAASEHHAGVDPVEHLEQEAGAIAVWAPLDQFGVIDLNWLEDYLEANGQKVALISLMWVNNETGLITPIPDLTKLAKRFGIPVHCDAVAAFGHIPISFKESGLSTMAVSGHKFGAPVGVGALVVARDAKLAITSHGGGQERGIRSGTLSAALAYALSTAAALAAAEVDSERQRIAALAKRIINFVQQAVPD